jgi:hypothetical protein
MGGCENSLDGNNQLVHNQTGCLYQRNLTTESTEYNSGKYRRDKEWFNRPVNL